MHLLLGPETDAYVADCPKKGQSDTIALPEVPRGELMSLTLAGCFGLMLGRYAGKVFREGMRGRYAGKVFREGIQGRYSGKVFLP